MSRQPDFFPSSFTRATYEKQSPTTMARQAGSEVPLLSSEIKT